MSEIKRGSLNVYYNNKEFIHVVRFFHKNGGSSAAHNARTRWAFLVVGRDELSDAFIHDKEMNNEDRIKKIKDDYLPLLEECVKAKKEPAYTLDKTKISEVGTYPSKFKNKWIIRQSTPSKDGSKLKSLLKGFGFSDEASALKNDEKMHSHFGYLKLDAETCKQYLYAENSNDEAYAVVALPYIYNKKGDAYEALVLREDSSVSLMPKVLVEYGVFFDGTKNSMYNVDFNLDFHKYLKDQTEIVLDNGIDIRPPDKVQFPSTEGYSNVATYIREVDKPQKDKVINAIRDEIQDNIRYFQNASKDEIAGEKTKYKSWWQDRASDHADKVFDFLVSTKDLEIKAHYSGYVRNLDFYEDDHVMDPSMSLMEISNRAVTAGRTGIIKEVRVQSGQHVSKGDVLIVLHGKLENDARNAVEDKIILASAKEKYKEDVVKKYIYDEVLPSGEGSSFVNGYTNIKRLFEHYKGYDPLNLRESQPRKYTKDRFKVYASGDGCIDPYEGGKLRSDSAIGLGLAFGKTGVLAHIVYTCDKIAKNLRQKEYGVVDELVLDIFGFSRGAAEARHFVSSIMKKYNSFTENGSRKYTLNTMDEDKTKNIFNPFYPEDDGVYTMIDNSIYFNPLRIEIEKVTIEDSNGDDEEYLNPYYKKYVKELKIDAVSFRFIGIYDTVAHYGICQANDNQDLNLNFVEDKLGRLVHLTAEDEYRKNFAMTHIKEGSSANFKEDKKMKEISLPGAHADVGGGYMDKENSPRYIADKNSELLLKWNEKYAWIENKDNLQVSKAKDIKEIKRNKIEGFYRIDNVVEADNLYMYRPNISNKYEHVCMKLMHDEALNSDDKSEKVPLDNISIKYEIDQHDDAFLYEVYTKLKKDDFEMHGKMHQKLRQGYLHHSSDLDGIAPVDVNMPSMQNYLNKKVEIYGKRVKYSSTKKQSCFTSS